MLKAFRGRCGAMALDRLAAVAERLRAVPLGLELQALVEELRCETELQRSGELWRALARAREEREELRQALAQGAARSAEREAELRRELEAGQAARREDLLAENELLRPGSGGAVGAVPGRSCGRRGSGWWRWRRRRGRSRRCCGAATCWGRRKSCQRRSRSRWRRSRMSRWGAAT